MATHANVTVKCSDGKYRSIYVHSDGYEDAPHGIGYYLRTYHNSQELAEEVVRHGNASAIYAKTNPNPGEPHSFENPQTGVSVYYGRDRGDEPDISSGGFGTSYSSALQDAGFGEFEYQYVWDGNSWTRK